MSEGLEKIYLVVMMWGVIVLEWGRVSYLSNLKPA